jgi:hypothetical protein
MRNRNRMWVAAGLALLAALAFSPAPAGAMALPAAASVNAAAKAVDPIETVHCRSVWRCGTYDCGWRRVCHAPRPYYDRPYYDRPYVHYRPYYRPYYRRYVPPPWVSGPWSHARPRYYYVGPWIYSY